MEHLEGGGGNQIQIFSIINFMSIFYISTWSFGSL